MLLYFDSLRIFYGLKSRNITLFYECLLVTYMYINIYLCVYIYKYISVYISTSICLLEYFLKKLISCKFLTLSSWAIPERNSKMFCHCANKLIVLYHFFVILEKFIHFFYIFLDSFWPHDIIKLAKWGHQRTADIGEITFSEKILIKGRIVWSNFINNLTSQLKKKKKKKIWPNSPHKTLGK